MTVMLRAALVLPLLMAACADRSANGNAAQPEPATAASPSPTGPARGRLMPLSAADIADANLSGDLACAFADEGGRAVFHATGLAGSSRVAEGLIRLGGTVARVTAPGGYDRMVDGTTFASPVTKVRIWNIGAAEGDGASPPRPATLNWTAGDGTQGSVSGRWTCGR